MILGLNSQINSLLLSVFSDQIKIPNTIAISFFYFLISLFELFLIVQAPVSIFFRLKLFRCSSAIFFPLPESNCLDEFLYESLDL